MTVHELIEELKKIRNQNLEVVFEEFDGTYGFVNEIEVDNSYATLLCSLGEN